MCLFTQESKKAVMRKPYRNQKEDINSELAPKGGRNGMGSRDEFISCGPNKIKTSSITNSVCSN